MQIKPAWKAARNFPIQPLLSSQQCRLPLVIAFPGDYLILACQFSLILCDCLRTCSSFYWLHSWNEFINRASFSLSIWSKNIWKLIFFCQNEETDAHSKFYLWKGLRRGLGFRNASELLCLWASLVLCRSAPEGCMGVLLDVGIAGAPKHLCDCTCSVCQGAVSAKGQFCYENLQPF